MDSDVGEAIVRAIFAARTKQISKSSPKASKLKRNLPVCAGWVAPNGQGFYFPCRSRRRAIATRRLAERLSSAPFSYGETVGKSSKWTKFNNQSNRKVWVS